MSGEASARITIASVDKTTEVIERLKRKFPELNKAVERSNQSFRNFSASTKGWSEAANRIGASLKSVGMAMSVGLTLPVIAAGGFALKAFSDYQTALIGLGRTTMLRGPELDALGMKFVELSKKIPIPVNDLINLGQTAAQFGITGSDGVLKFAQTMGMLAKTTSIVGDEAVQSFGRFIRATGGSMENADRFGSALVALRNSTGASEAEIVELSTKLAATGTLFNLGSTQILGMSAAFTSLGIEGKAGATVVGKSLEAINAAIQGGGQKMAILSKLTGIAGDQLKSQFHDNALGVLQQFAGGLKKVTDGGGDVTGAMKYFGVGGVRNLAVLGALTNHMDVFNDKMKVAADAYASNTALSNQFGDASQSLANKWQLLKNQATALGIILGEKLAPMAGRALDVLISGLSWLSAHPTFATFAAGVAVLVAALGPLLYVAGLISTAMPVLVGAFALLTGTLIPLAVAGWAALAPFLIAAAPFIAIGAAIIALIAVLVIFRKSIAEYVVAAFDWALEKAMAFWDVLKSIAKDMGSVFGIGGGGVNVSTALMPPTGPGGIPMLSPQGPATGALEMQSRANTDFYTQTNNARVDINVRAPQSTSIRSESNGGFLSINRGLAGQ